jgi:hypothetical protein
MRCSLIRVTTFFHRIYSLSLSLALFLLYQFVSATSRSIRAASRRSRFAFRRAVCSRRPRRPQWLAAMCSRRRYRKACCKLDTWQHDVFSRTASVCQSHVDGMKCYGCDVILIVSFHSYLFIIAQRVTDVILRAFDACAASQGCMNNFTLGNDRFGYVFVSSLVLDCLFSWLMPVGNNKPPSLVFG